MVTADQVRTFALSLPQAEEHDHWGKPSFRVRNKIFLVIRADELRLVVKVTPEDRTALTTLEPEIYSIPPQFANTNYLFVQMDRIDPAALPALLTQAWRCVVPRRLAASYPPPN